MRIAAVADTHVREGDRLRVATIFANVKREADVLVIAGDLTQHGRPEEMAVLVSVLAEISVPVVAVFGNHDHEFGGVADCSNMLRAAGVHLLDPGRVVIDGVGFAGAKGYAGGFGERMVRSFGEASLKAFVAESAIEATALQTELLSLPTRARVAVTHFSPVRATVTGEPPEIHAFLGTSRLAEAIDEGRATVAFHGHAHNGSPEGRTAGGVPVFNVSLPVLERAGGKRPYHIFDIEVPAEDARRRADQSSGAMEGPSARSRSPGPLGGSTIG
jgi:Icc-related predicted phosphoesterase